MKKVSKINSNRLKDIRVVDLFAGIGGFHLAFEKYGAKVVYASEWDEKASAVYYNNFKLKPDGDITKIEASSIPEHDVLCSGFPCQPFSIIFNKDALSDMNFYKVSEKTGLTPNDVNSIVKMLR